LLCSKVSLAVRTGESGQAVALAVQANTVLEALGVALQIALASGPVIARLAEALTVTADTAVSATVVGADGFLLDRAVKPIEARGADALTIAANTMTGAVIGTALREDTVIGHDRD